MQVKKGYVVKGKKYIFILNELLFKLKEENNEKSLDENKIGGCSGEGI